MKSYKILAHASQAFCAAIALVWCATGCERREEKPLPEVYPAEGHAYMKDPAFKAQLEAQEKEREKILESREKLIEKFEALEKRMGSRAAAEKLPEWKQLESWAAACGRAYESNRWQTTEMLRERMVRAQADSERIARGEAKAKEISK